MRSLLIAVAGAALFSACGGPPRTITGNVQARQQAVVLAQDSSGRVFASTVMPSGSFRLTVATPARYRLVLAQRTAQGFTVTTPILWSSATGTHPWALVLKGDRLLLGEIGPRSAIGQDQMEAHEREEMGAPDDDVERGRVCPSDHQRTDGGEEARELMGMDVDRSGADIDIAGDVRTDDGTVGDEDGDHLNCGGGDDHPGVDPDEGGQSPDGGVQGH